MRSEVKQQLIQTWRKCKQAFIEYLEKLKTDIDDIIRIALATKIAMLGTTGTGKTCYTIGMQTYMQNIGVNGFRITCVNSNQASLIKERWRKIYRRRGAYRWPARTDRSVEYSFNFN